MTPRVRTPWTRSAVRAIQHGTGLKLMACHCGRLTERPSGCCSYCYHVRCGQAVERKHSRNG